MRPTWDEYFMMFAKLAASRSTCLAFPVGAVIVQDRQIIATGYNGPPSGLPHCIEQGFCYEGVKSCTDHQMPSRAVHAEANALAQAAKHGISTLNASMYITLEPCLSCLKLIIASGITTIYYEETFDKNKNNPVIQSFYDENLISSKQIHISSQVTEHLVSILTHPTSVARSAFLDSEV